MEVRHLPQPSLNLSARRAQRGLTLEQIAGTTKIGVYFLRAIESEQFHLLPGGIFTTSYLRQYAEATGCSAADLLEAAGVQPRVQEEAASSGSGPRWRSIAGLLRQI
jgi:cytoskeletal protein RodZ